MNYRYIDNARFQLWFDTPNHCGAFLAMTAVASMVLFLFLKDRGEFKWKVPLLAAVFCGIVAQEAGLAMTYSRGGGYVALAVGIMFAWMMDRRKWAGFFLLSFLVSLLLTANGIDRVRSMAATADGSISHRLLFWEGGWP